MLPDPPEDDACSSVILIPGPGDASVGGPQFSDEGGDSQPIHHHRQWISLGHFIINEEKVTRPISRPNNQCSPVVVEVEC